MLPHAFDAIQTILSAAECTQRRQKPDAGSAVFQPQIGGLRRDLSRQSMHSAGTGSNILFDCEAQTAQAFDHDACVLAVEHSGERRGSVSERCQNHRPVCDALGAWRTNGAMDWRCDGDDFNERHRHTVAPSLRRREFT